MGGILVVAAIGVVLATNNPIRLAPYLTGLLAGAILFGMAHKWALVVRKAQAFEHVEEILDDAMKKGPLGPENTEYALANGIMHGLRYLSLCQAPGQPGSEFQAMCDEAERRNAKRSG